MGWNKIKLRQADTVFSKYIRTKANWTCEYCKKICKINGYELHRLEASHYFSRRKESVRFDERNVHALCSSCHKRMGGYQKNEQGEYDLWMKQILGEREYRKLMIDANTYHKPDDLAVILIYKQKLKELC